MKVELDKLQEYGNLELLARQLVEGFITGLHKSPYHGFSVEFAEHRLYNTGESTRYIDWKVFARTEKLFVKQFEEETNLRCKLVLDNSPSMHYPYSSRGKLRFSVIAAAALAFLLIKQRDAVGLSTFSDVIEENTDVKSTKSHLNKILMILEKLLRQKVVPRGTDAAGVIHEIASHSHKRSLIILFSDLFDREEDDKEMFAALQHLKHKKHEVLIFHVTDFKTEKNFEFQDRPYEFIDLESGDKLKVKPSEIRDKYKTEINTFYRELKLKCAQFKIDLIEVDISEDIDHVLRSYLIKRTRMK